MLQDGYCFDGAERRPSDEWLDAVVGSREVQTSTLPLLVAQNEAADKAWRSARELQEGSAGGSLDREQADAEVRRLRMTAAMHYAALLKAGSCCLHPNHAWMHNARVRLAMVMTASRAARSCANALPLWRAALEAARDCYPPHWPSLLPLLSGACIAAQVAGDKEAFEAWSSEKLQVASVLGKP
mmetsp:Transcript_35585/g.100721  ORF Transcript_35585/g.100721 Transcript_35585/m.100721 type:complete len:184 (-) Transcript_35585:6-557(-)